MRADAASGDDRVPQRSPGPSTPLLQVKHLSMLYRREGQTTEMLAVDDISFDVGRGEFVCIVGPSGCGKTTILETIAGLRTATKGRVTVEGLSIGDVTARRRIGIVFQEDTLFPWREVLSNTEFALEMRGVAKAERRKRAREALRLLGLSDFEGHYVSELSGGMRQRVAFARTLVTEPHVLLLDEPFGALDAQTRLIVGTEVSSIAEKLHATALMVTHSIEEAALLSDRIIVMSARPGTIKATIPAALAHPRGLRWAGSTDVAAISAAVWAELRSEVAQSRQDPADW